jgi:hypothetical protein
MFQRGCSQVQPFYLGMADSAAAEVGPSRLWVVNMLMDAHGGRDPGMCYLGAVRSHGLPACRLLVWAAEYERCKGGFQAVGSAHCTPAIHHAAQRLC